MSDISARDFDAFLRGKDRPFTHLLGVPAAVMEYIWLSSDGCFKKAYPKLARMLQVRLQYAERMLKEHRRNRRRRRR